MIKRKIKPRSASQSEMVLSKEQERTVIRISMNLEDKRRLTAFEKTGFKGRRVMELCERRGGRGRQGEVGWGLAQQLSCRHSTGCDDISSGCGQG